jgi:SAM-dependent methyltransferase
VASQSEQCNYRASRHIQQKFPKSLVRSGKTFINYKVLKMMHRCLFCKAPLTHLFADLGTCPPSNSFLTAEQCEEPVIFYPLKVYVCDKCLLVQGPHYKRPQDIFTHDYVYHSSWSRTWVKHAEKYVQTVVERFSLEQNSLIVEIGSNDGYLLQHAVERGIPCLGIDPSTGAASIAQTKGIPTITDFFTHALACRLREQGKRADLICGINVFAHVPDINNLVAGMAHLLQPHGIVTMEFPHVMRLVEETQFDTIYHEHYFYYTLACVKNILKKHGLTLFDVEELPTHGGSLRIYACPVKNARPSTGMPEKYLLREEEAGMGSLAYYLDFQEKIDHVRRGLMSFLLDAGEQGRSVVGYGAAAKGNTLINYFGIRKDMLPFVADTSPVKQGKFLPGSRIPVVAETQIRAAKPDYILILPWNLKEEISEQLVYIREWGGKFVTAIPKLTVW